MTNLIAYRVAPQCERKAARELRENGRRAYLPLEMVGKRKAPVARGYIFSDPKPAFAKHVRSAVGAVSRGDLARLYPERKARRVEFLNPYSVGQPVMKGDVPAVVDEVRDRMCIISWEMLGKRMSQAIHYTQLRPG